MKLLIGKWHIFIDAPLSEATLPWIPLIRISEYLASLMKLLCISIRSEGFFVIMLTTRTRDDDSCFKGCCKLEMSAIPGFV